MLLAGFSLVVAIGVYSLVAVQRLLIAMASLVGSTGFRCRGSVAVVHVLTPQQWNLPRAGIKPMSPVLTGKFPNTGPPKKSLHVS